MGRGESRAAAGARHGRPLIGPRAAAALRLAAACAVCAVWVACTAPAPPPAGTWREERAVVTIDDRTALVGSLALPVGTAPASVAAVLLLGGSGPQDRDGARVELAGYAPWREFSDALAAAGMAVLRLDDRGTGESGGRFAGATTDDFARDAAAAVRWLRRHPAIDGARIGLVGHSEGAVVALLAARADPALTALVLLGAPSRPGRDIARWQREQLVSRDQARWPGDARMAVLAAANAEAERLAVADPWLGRWFALDPRDVAAAVRQPVLLLHGDTDRQVPPTHADELARALRRAGVGPVEVRRFPHTDHLLLPDYDGDPEGYVRLGDRRVRREILAATTQFLAVHMAAR